MQSNMKIKKFYFNNKQNIEQKGKKNQKNCTNKTKGVIEKVYTR